MITCTKVFANYPFAHRQWTHDGHCQFIHGHNWNFEIQFCCTTPDSNGFVMDFGKMGSIKEWLTKMFDHTLLINEDDPKRDHIVDSLSGLADIRIVPNGGAEAIAKLVMDHVNEILESDLFLSGRKVRALSVRVYEDEKNSATVRYI